MSLIWIATREVNEVREAWPEWLNAHKVWDSFELGDKTCWKLEPLCRKERVIYDRYSDEASRAVKVLWRALQTGEIVATGINKRDEIRRVIRPEEWYDVTVCGSHPVIAYFLDSICFGDPGANGWQGGEVIFSDLLLPVKDLLRVFPGNARAIEDGRCWNPSLEAVLSQALRENPKLTQVEAVKIARERGLEEDREKIRTMLKSLGGSSKPGPKGPWKNRAAPSA
jgi:hypothetical protein